MSAAILIIAVGTIIALIYLFSDEIFGIGKKTDDAGEDQ